MLVLQKKILVDFFSRFLVLFERAFYVDFFWPIRFPRLCSLEGRVKKFFVFQCSWLSVEMGFKGTKAEKKVAYDKKLCQFLEEYTQVLVCAADNVGSKQLQGIRKGLRPDSNVLMGKNTMMKRSIRIHAEKTGNDAYLNLLPLLVVSSLSKWNLSFFPVFVFARGFSLGLSSSSGLSGFERRGGVK